MKRSKEVPWEEKYLTLRDQHEELKKQSNQQQKVIKQSFARLQMIEGSLAKRGGNDENSGPSGSQKKIGRNDRETENLIASLRKENHSLRKANLELREKLRNGGGGKPSMNASTLKAAAVSSNGKDSEIVASLRKRLLGMEKRMKALHEQNNVLRRREQHPHVGRPPVPPPQEMPNDTPQDLLSLQRELKDKDAQILIVKNRYDHLEAKARAAAEIHERTVFMMEEGNRTIRDLRRKVQALQHDNEGLAVHQQRADELALELASTREDSRRLEERMTALCESPFINDAFESRSRVDKLVALERADRQQKVQIEHLKETAKMHHAEILALKSSSEQLCKQRDLLSKENHQLKLKAEQVERGAGLLEDKMKLYSGEAGVDSTQLEKALTIVKRNDENMGQVGFLESSTPENVIPGMKQKLQQLQVLHLNACRELEMTERMLKAQTSINKDLNSEINELQQKLKGSNNELHRKLDDYETLCSKRLQKIHALEAQVKQLLKKKQKKLQDDDVDDDAASVVSLAASASDFGPGENLIEIWVMGASLNENKVEPGVTTFVMLDFYDYETQTSPLLSGLHPKYNFAATYRIKVDHFFLRYLASETLTLELNRTKHADYELLGQCTLSMRSLLESSGKFKCDEAEIISSRDGSVLGTFKICIRLALPISDLFEVYLREMPGERERIEKLRLAEQQDQDMVIAKAKAQNQLEVTIISCTGLSTKHTPSPYAHYQLLSFPDTFTPIVQNTCDPVFEQRVPFPLLVDNKLLRYIERENLEINILDDNEDDDNEGVLGKTSIPLNVLCKGQAITGSFSLRDNDGMQAGSVEVRIAWRNPLISKEEVSLSNDQCKMQVSEEQLREIIKKYERNGSVDWKSFLKLSVPGNDSIQNAQRRLRKIFSKAMDQGMDMQTSFAHFDKTRNGVISMKELEISLEELGVRRMSEDDMRALFRHLDRKNTGSISFDEFVLFAQPLPEAMRIAERKIMRAFSDLKLRGEDIERPFKRRQVEGLISVRDFCKALRELGFDLVDREKPTKDPRDEVDFEKNEETDLNTKVQQVEDVVKEEEEVVADIDETETFYNRKKAEFEERINRASQASSNTFAEQQSVEREMILKTYGGAADTSALRLQSHFRGYKSRRQVQDGKMAKGGNDMALFAEAEDALRQALASTECDLRGAFVKSDKERQGTMTVGKFIRTLSACKLGLMSNHATTLAAAFSNDDGKVDFYEFIRFAVFQPRDISGLSFHLRNAILQIRSVRDFTDIDQGHSGFVSRRDFVKVVKEQIKGLGSHDINTLVDIFDNESNGEIDYVAFVKFAQSQPLAVALYAVEDKLRDVMKKAASQGINLEQSFSVFDKNGDGAVSRSEFKQALRAMRFDLTQKQIHALYARFDPSRRGTISYREFVKFVAGDSNERRIQTSANPDLNKTQYRLQNIVRNALTAGLSVHGPFEHYDWKRTGSIPRELFNRACSFVGFPLTVNELDALAELFASGPEQVKYTDFIEWTTPKHAQLKDVVTKLQVVCDNGNFATTFSKFDSFNRGEVSRKEFGTGLSSMGIELSREELITLMNQFDRDGDGFIQYEEFVKTLQPARVSGARGATERSPRAASTSDKKPHVVFESFDKTFSGKISREDFATGLAQLDMKNVDASKYTDDEGNVRYRQFLVENQEHQAFMFNVTNKLVQLVADGDVQQVPFEHDGDGIITFSNFRKGLESLNFDLEEAEIFALADAFGGEGDGSVSLEKFTLATRKARKPPPVGISADHQQFMKQLLYTSRRRGFNLREMFEQHDRGTYRYVGLNEFLDVLRKIDSNSRINELATALDMESDSRVDYLYLLHACDLDKKKWMIEEQLRRMIKEQAAIHGDIRVPFTHFDRKRKGKFGMQAWSRAGNDLGLSLSEDLFKSINLSGSGKITLNEFIVFVNDPEYKTQLERKLRKFIISFVVLGESYDETSLVKIFGREKLDRHSLKQALKKIGLGNLTRNEIVRIITRYDVSGEGKVVPQDPMKFFSRAFKLGRQAVTITSRMDKNIGLDGTADGGVMDKRSFIRTLVESGAGVDEGNLYRLADCFDFGDLGMVDVQEFVGFLSSFSSVGKAGQGQITNDSDSSGTEEDEERMIKSITSKLHKIIEKARDQGVNYHKSFEHFDEDGSGEISFEEFRHGLETLGFSLSKRKIKTAFQAFAGKRGDSIKYRDFLQSFVSPEDAFLEEVTEKLRKMINKRAEHNGGGTRGLKKTFRHFDKQGKGYVSKSSFKEGLEAFSDFELNNSEVKIVMEKFDFDDNGRISFEEFKKFAGGKTADVQSPSPRGSSRSKRDKSRIELEADEIANKLRSLIRKAHKKGVDYRQSFEHFDPHYAGSIDAGDFKRGLNGLGFDISPEHVRILLQRFAGSNGRIRYRDFLKAVAPRDEAGAEEIAQKLRRLLSKVGNLRKAFKHFERNRNGNISRKAFKRGMETLNFNLTDSEVRILMDMFDEDGDGEISFDEFVDFAASDDHHNLSKRRKKYRSESDDSTDDEANNEESVLIACKKLKITRPSSSFDRVYIQYQLPELDFVRTPAQPFADTKKRQTIKIGYENAISAGRDSKARKALKMALRTNRCNVKFQVIGVKASGRTKTLGQAKVDLQDICEDQRDMDNQELVFFDDDQEPTAKLNISIKALDVLTVLA